ncbi:hypothetical protein [Curtobacterium sp. MCPF17_052]|uniref:hypothetical protein n=1 Tax=Curtobacterium sp. MCPF17_052 TaxID=2175655 RepID=UPI0024DFF1B0|nr:hypothetical protein [Curtobacterium sp. MCPF17_052]WIB13461.1 hypothetical protein DEJ36_06615 [Curtobacterium sp. MCPF17_052]
MQDVYLGGGEMRVNLTRRGTLAGIGATAAALLTVVVLAGCSVGMGKSPKQAKQSIVTFVEGSTDVVGDGWAARTSSSTFEAGAARWAHPTSARTPRGYTIDGGSLCVAGDFDKMSLDSQD